MPMSRFSGWRGSFLDRTTSCRVFSVATLQRAPVTSLRDLAPAFSRLGRWWRTFGWLPDQWVVVSRCWNTFVSHVPRSQRMAGSCTRRHIVAEEIADTLGSRHTEKMSSDNSGGTP